MAAFGSKSSSHPFLRAEYSFKQRRQVKIGIAHGKIQAESRRADLDLAELIGRRVFPAYDIFRKDLNSSGPRIITRSHSSRSRLHNTQTGQNEGLSVLWIMTQA